MKKDNQLPTLQNTVDILVDEYSKYADRSTITTVCCHVNAAIAAILHKTKQPPNPFKSSQPYSYVIVDKWEHKYCPPLCYFSTAWLLKALRENAIRLGQPALFMIRPVK